MNTREQSCLWITGVIVVIAGIMSGVAVGIDGLLSTFFAAGSAMCWTIVMAFTFTPTENTPGAQAGSDDDFKCCIFCAMCGMALAVVSLCSCPRIGFFMTPLLSGVGYLLFRALDAKETTVEVVKTIDRQFTRLILPDKDVPDMFGVKVIGSEPGKRCPVCGESRLTKDIYAGRRTFICGYSCTPLSIRGANAVEETNCRQRHYCKYITETIAGTAGQPFIPKQEVDRRKKLLHQALRRV